MFAIVGIIVVAVIVAVLGLTADEGDPNPKTTLVLIFGVIAVFLVGLFALQRADLERAAAGDAATTSRAAATGGRQVFNPTVLSEQELWAAMAVAPIAPEALRSRAAGWDSGRRSLRLGALVVVLIMLTVPAIYLLESFVPLLIGGPLILAAALYGAARAIGPGGELDSAYDRLDQWLEPLGLRLEERPRADFEARAPAQPGFDYRLHGATVLRGKRHGRLVTVRLGEDERDGSEVTVAVDCREWEVESKLVTVRSDGDQIALSRRRQGQESWLCDLWVAERLASS